MSRFVLTSEAKSDVSQIIEFIARDSPDAADRVLNDLWSAMDDLALMPDAGHRRDDLADETLRVRASHRYLIIYRPDDRPIQIVRVLHGARDVGAVLGE